MHDRLILTPQEIAQQEALDLPSLVRALQAAGRDNARLEAELMTLRLYLAAMVHVRGGKARLQRAVLAAIQQSTVQMRIGHDETHAHIEVEVTRPAEQGG